jgi:HNH endonuclease
VSKAAIPDWLRDRVLAQAGYRCGYCRSSSAITGTGLEIDHLTPESLGGPTVEENLWAACRDCNNAKKARVEAIDPATGTRVPLFNPRRQRWGGHFAWQEGGLLIVGLTSTGRATVQALKLNRPLLVRARRLWIGVGWHPPIEA